MPAAAADTIADTDTDTDTAAARMRAGYTGRPPTNRAPHARSRVRGPG